MDTLRAFVRAGGEFTFHHHVAAMLDRGQFALEPCIDRSSAELQFGNLTIILTQLAR